jgi:hypothetical protein
MQNSLRANLEFGAQIVIAVAVLAVAGVIVQRHVFPRQLPYPNMAGITAGERLNISDVDWKRSKRSLVFFLSKDCYYCTSSAPFYRQLTVEAAKRNVTLLAVLPDSPADAKAYLQSIKLPIEDLRTGPLSSYKIAGTPTVLLVNTSGAVEKVWFGATTGRENQILEEFLILTEEPLN